MEQRTNDDISTEQIEDSSNSPPQKRAKRQPGDNSQQIETTSFNADPSGEDLPGVEHVVNQSSNNFDDRINHQRSRNGISNFIVPSDCVLAPEENLEPNSAGLKSS